MIDFTLFGFTMAVLLIGVLYACTCSNISGEDDVEDDGRGNEPTVSNVVRFIRRNEAAADRESRSMGRRRRMGQRPCSGAAPR
jgi:hypothetical protein